jgi:hypothetical protein
MLYKLLVIALRIFPGRNHFLLYVDIQLNGIGGKDMRIITTRKVKRLAVVILSLLLVIVLAVNIAGYILSKDRSEDAADTIEQVDKYKVRSELLMEAMKHVCVCSPEEAVDLWVTGLMQRNAAIQYSVMSDAMKKEYAKDLEKSAPNWVTGMSSPYVSGYEVVKTETPDENTRVVKLAVRTETSTGPAGNFNAVLTITKDDHCWRLTKLAMDKQLYPYTGFVLD